MDQRFNLQLWQQKIQALPWLAPLWARVPLLLVAAMTIALAQLAAQMSWQVLTPSTIEISSVQSPTSNSVQSAEKGLADVVNAHLFGKLVSTAAKGPINAPVTRLKLSLNGVFASADPKVAMAIISDAGGEQKHYRIGDAVPGGAKVHAIYPDRVILDRLGQLETLKLPREIAPYDAAESTSVVISDPQLPIASSRTHKLQASEKVKQLRETLVKSPEDIWKDVRIEPVMTEGRVEGYRFAHKDQRLMQSLGLTTDDIIVEINGRTLSDPSMLYEIMSQITTMENVRLTIKRNGQTETIEIIM